jgi:hypothetical protein
MKRGIIHHYHLLSSPWVPRNPQPQTADKYFCILPPQSSMQTSTDIAFNLAAINRAACNWYNFSIAVFIYKLGSFL